MFKKIINNSFILLCLFQMLLCFLYPQVAKGENIKVGIETEGLYTTARLQPLVGKWKLRLEKKQTTGNLIINEEILSGEDAVLMLIPKGLILKVSSELNFDQGFDKITISGGELINMELPSTSPKILCGSIEITHDNSYISIVNTLPMDKYTVSCASTEIISCELEAVKAHIIAVETKINYLKSHSRHPQEPFDVCDGQHCIKYLGSGSNRELVELLYESLKQHLLFYNNKLIYPRYHHTCGGKISSAKDIYGYQDEPYHTAHKDLLNNKGSENCFHSPSFHWTIETQSSIAEDFLSMEFAGGADNVYTKCEPLVINEEGRILALRIKGKKIKEIHGIEFLNHLQNFYGLNSIKSMRYTYEPLKRSILIRGMGEGDGVGMCLYGADGLAKKGQNYKQILEFYYPGTTLK